jgi:hypothetical protein
MLIFFEKKVFKKNLGTTKFYEKMCQKKITDFLLSFNSKSSHFDKNLSLNLNLKSQMLSPTWRKSKDKNQT